MELEDAADAVERVDDKFGLFGVVFIEEVDEDFEAAASMDELDISLKAKNLYSRDEHLQCQNGRVAQ